MKLAAGVVARRPWASSVEGAVLVQFSLAIDALDQVALLDSAFASPGRYAGEILRRLRQAYPEARACVALNPYVEMPTSLAEHLVDRAIAWAPDGEHAFTVISDGRRPLAYVLSAAAADRCPPEHLGLLSCTDAALDERLLRASLGPGRCRSIGHLAGLGAVDAGNDFRPLSPAVAWAARRAAEVLEALPSDAARGELVEHGDRCAVVGFHAGDVLFCAQALRLEVTRFRSALMLSMYGDIFEYVAPDVRRLLVDQPAPNRPDHQIHDELAWLWELVTDLEAGGAAPRFWHLVRVFRDHARVRHHLREAMAFALGGSGHPLRRLPPHELALRERRLSVPEPGRVVVHFEGGWELKEYPRERRGELLLLLQEAGYRPIVLGRPESSASDIPAVPYTDLASFRALLSSAEALIGCDSFPAHFSQQLGVPTLQLFGSTRADNSRGTSSLRYRHLQHPLPCVPCSDLSTCRLDGGHACRAHLSASEVLSALRELVPGPALTAERPVRTLAETERLLAEEVPHMAMSAVGPLSEAARERFLDRLYAGFAFERLVACPLCGGRELREVGRKFRLPVAACSGCGLWLVTERITAGDLHRLYSEQYWTEFMRLHDYPTHVERYAFDYAAALERVVDLAELVPAGATVLDVGCALGTVPRRLRESGYRAAGLEVDPAMARKATLLSGVPVYTSLAAVQASEPPIEAAIMYDVFEHLYEPVPFLESLAGAMAPGGVLVVETFRSDSPAFRKLGMEHEDVKPIEHPFMYRREHIEQILRRASFEPMRVRHPLGDSHARIRIAARKVERQAARSAGAA